MKVPFPQIDLPRGISGGSDAWDNLQAGVLLIDDYFDDAAVPLAITLLDSDVFESGSGGFNSTHTFPDIDILGTNTIHIAAGFNRNPASDVSGWTSEGNAMSSIVDSINANVVAVSLWRYLINALAVTTVSSTPSFKLQAGIVAGFENVDQTTPITGTPVTAGGFGTTATASYTGTAGNMLVVSVSTQNDRTFTPVDCDLIQSVTHADGSLGSGFLAYIPATGSAQTIGATISSGDNWQIAIFELKLASSGGGSFSQSCTETIVLNDSSFRTPSKRLIDAFVLVDTVRKTPSRTLIDAFTLVDTVRRTTTRTLTDSIALVDTFAGKITARLLSEAISLVDTVSKTTSRTITEIVTLVDTIIRTTTRRLTEVITVVDSYSRVIGKSLKEWIILYDGDATLKNGTMASQPPFTAPTVATSGRWIDGTASGSTNNANDTWGWGTMQTGIGTSTTQFTNVDGKDCILIDALDMERNAGGGTIIGINHAAIYTGPTVTTGQRPYYIPVKEGINYTFGGEIYVNSVSIPAQVGINIGVLYYDINLNRLGTQPSVGAVVTTLGSWQSISTSGAAPTGAAFAILSARTLGTGVPVLGLDANFAVTNLFFRKTTAVDSIKIFLSRTLTESVALVDTLIRTSTRTFIESIVVADIMRRTIGKLLAEFIHVKESEFYYGFDGISSWAGVATGNPILPQNSPISIYCRFRTPAVFTGTYHRVMIKAYGSVSANRAGSIQLSTTNRRIDFTMVDQAGVSYDLSTGNNSVNENTEYEILGTWDPITGTMNIYMNSPTLLATRAGGLNTPTGTSQFSYATEQNTGTPPYIAIKVKAGAVWNRVINSEEITNLFVNKSFVKNGLRVLHTFKEGSGNTVADSSGNGKTLTITNGASGAWFVDDLFRPHDGLKISMSRRLLESLSIIDLIEAVVVLPPKIGKWIAYSLTGLAKILRFGNKTHTLSTTKQSHVLLLSERSFTVSTTDITHTNRTNKTP